MNLDQLRAHTAFTFVQGYKGKRDAFLGLARTLPVMLQTNGLLAAWAHLLSKSKKEEYRGALDALLAHFRATPLRLVPAGGDPASVFTGIWNAPASPATGLQLRRLTAEAIAFSVWLKRAAEALLDEGDGAKSAGSSPAQPAPGAGARDAKPPAPGATASGEHKP
jgi:CRISPR/Cas system CMR-associated protein Cmr5 small subunit